MSPPVPMSHLTRARAAMRADIVASRASEHEELAARMEADAERESGDAATLCRAVAVVNRLRAACERECSAIYRRVADGGQP